MVNAKLNNDVKVEATETKAKVGANTAIVVNGTSEVRRYSIEDHGDKFIDLAHQFADKRKYTIKLITLEPGIICPACGHKFNP